MPSGLKGSSAWDILSTFQTLLTEPVFDGLFRLLREPFVPSRGENVKDESVGIFLSRRLGKSFADNLVSAVYHGIYAGDIYKLSARTLLPLPWHMETRDRDEGSGIIVENVSDLMQKRRTHGLDEIQDIERKKRTILDQHGYYRRVANPALFRDASVYTFKHGVGQVTTALEQYLRQNQNVTILESTSVDDIQVIKAQNGLRVWSRKATDNPKGLTHDYVASTLSPLHLQRSFPADKIQSQEVLSHLKLTKALKRSSASVNTMVVNLYYDNPKLLAVQGFGYLIPRSVPLEQNPERALGVIFGTETSGLHSKPLSADLPRYINFEWSEKHGTAIINRDSVEDHLYSPDLVKQDTAPGTKLTVILGGHWWHDWAEPDLPTEDQAIEMAPLRPPPPPPHLRNPPRGQSPPRPQLHPTISRRIRAGHANRARSPHVQIPRPLEGRGDLVAGLPRDERLCAVRKGHSMGDSRSERSCHGVTAVYARGVVGNGQGLGYQA